MVSLSRSSGRLVTAALALICASAVATSADAAPRKSASSAALRVAPLRVATSPVVRPPVVVNAPVAEERDRPIAAPDEDGGIFGPVRVGPLVGASFPRPVSLALMLKYKHAVGLGLEYSILPQMTIDGVTVNASAIAGDLRWFVFDSPVFLGAGFGVQSLKGTATFGPYSGYGESSKTFVTPRVGLLWTTSAGFSIGADVGVEIPVSSSLDVYPDIDEIRNNAVLATMTRGPLPDVHLVRMGWLF